jgi:hypothetical protein
LLGCWTLAACGPTSSPSADVLPADDWHAFEGTWTATGSRHVLLLGEGRRASTGDVKGTLLLRGASRPAVGFSAEAITLNDTATGMVGRSVWTDERGDQVYSELRGDGSATGNRIAGTIIGGTGRFAGAAGSYEFTWRFVLESEDGVFQGQSVGLKGRVRMAMPPSKAEGKGPQP